MIEIVEILKSVRVAKCYFKQRLMKNNQKRTYRQKLLREEKVAKVARFSLQL